MLALAEGKKKGFTARRGGPSVPEVCPGVCTG